MEHYGRVTLLGGHDIDAVDEQIKIHIQLAGIKYQFIDIEQFQLNSVFPETLDQLI